MVDLDNRYKHPKSKLNDSDMGPLAQALNQDVSIQRLPVIRTDRMVTNYSTAMIGEGRNAHLLSTTSGITDHLMKNRINMPQSIVQGSPRLKQILRESKVRAPEKQSLYSSQIFTES